MRSHDSRLRPPVKPHAPRPGASIGLVTPSSPITDFPRRTARALDALSVLGMPVIEAPLTRWDPARAPTPAALAGDIAWCCRHPDIDVILGTTGGLTSAQLLPHLDLELIGTSRKVLCGFSDLTSLCLGIHATTGLVTFHGPTLLPSFGDADGSDPYMVANLIAAWSPDAVRTLAAPPLTSHDSPWWDRDDFRPRRREVATPWRALTPGRAQGPLVGGHLTTLADLVGTRFLPDPAGCLLFLETTSDRVSDIVADLARLEDGGVLDEVAGLILARPLPVDQLGELETFMTELARSLSVPLLSDVDLGHTVPMTTLPIGVLATLDTAAGMLRVEEPAVDTPRSGDITSSVPAAGGQHP